MSVCLISLVCTYPKAKIYVLLVLYLLRVNFNNLLFLFNYAFMIRIQRSLDMSKLIV